MKLRIKFVDGIGYFAQVKHGVFSPWQKIGKHISGYGLYPAENLDYPMATQKEAVETAEQYKQWVAVRTAPCVYTYLQ